MLKKTVRSELVKLNPAEIVKANTLPANFKHVKTVALAVNDKCETLAAIRKRASLEISLNIIKIWIINLNDFLNISRKMNPAQIEETASLIYDEFYYLKTSDIALVFRRIKAGHYGQFYESIDGMKLIDMLYQYSQERINKHITDIETEANEIKYKTK